ncbi:MAG: hypothetical protein ABIB12_01080 [Patescibacteria group bacterium]
MDPIVSFNTTAISFTSSAILSAFIAWRAFFILQRQKTNPASEFFFKALVFMTFYMGVRGFVSFFFVHEETVLAFAYLLSHIFLGIAVAYIVKFSVSNFFQRHTAQRFFYLTLFLFGLDVLLNVFFPNTPEFHAQSGIVDWGTHTYVAIFHTGLLWGGFLLAASLFLSKVAQYWSDTTLRYRSLLIALGLISAIVVVIPRNLVESPLMIVISDIGFIISLALILFGVSFRAQETQNPHVQKPTVGI